MILSGLLETNYQYQLLILLLKGKCQPVGCDGKLFSKMKEDACGICGGNSSDCSNVKNSYRKKLKREINRLAVIPRLTRGIKVEANLTTSMNPLREPDVEFVLKDRRKRMHTIAKSNIGSQTEIIEGTKFNYKRQLYSHVIWATGPLLAEMILLLQASKSEIEKGLNVSVNSEYYIHKNMLNSSTRYAWNLGGWGPCSSSCGGGRRQKTIACRDKQDNRIVPRRRCSLLPKPIMDTERCNTFSCNFHWIVGGDWEPCTATCGSSGIQSRELYCVPQSVINGSVYPNIEAKLEQVWRFMVSPGKCVGIAPATTRSCNRIPCPSYWEYDWTQCSASCGLGVSMKKYHCPPPDGDNYFTCGPSPPDVKKSCRSPFNRVNNPSCRRKTKRPCVSDQSKFCSLPPLERYCSLAGFRRICCKSCSNVLLSPVAS